MYYRQRWRDRRLAYTKEQWHQDELTLGYLRLSRIWLPDTFFPHEKTSIEHIITTPNVLLRLNRTGHILYSSRLDKKWHF
jgi:hypothetical protein